ncbi:2-hydroxyacid dehydrogenase [Pseudarthrobacter sp. C4D7]|uniref:2-hydroxyacid dehydrogenase n=1 Tax=Pseudarthrobacter sp. C4D7 TaxID=2735268 RepID=UPI001584E057|nr:NAD(P)-dependent oxidoreductase [Pseudarthrobacter sp. C4D7]NUT72189.1 glyoxylate reductase [Pseudarthrobacter sp. C4D7]
MSMATNERTTPAITARRPFTVAVTADAARPDGSSIHGDLGLRRLTDGGVDWHVLPSYTDPIPPADLARVDAVLSLGHIAFDSRTLDHAPDLKLVARFGAGFDTIDLAACTRAGVVVTNTPDAIRRPLAVAGLTLLLALSHKLLAKDRLTRTSNWGAREHYRGAPLVGQTVGIVGFGSVGAELARLLAPLGMKVVGNNRSGRHPEAGELGLELLGLEELLERSDYVVLCAALTHETEKLIDAAALARMKPTAYLINIGRGRLVDTDALRQALQAGGIAGAGLDVFEPEPLEPDDLLLTLDNVVLSPHSLCWTEDFTRDVSAAALGSILAMAAGEKPGNVLNPEVFETPAFAAKAAHREEAHK